MKDKLSAREKNVETQIGRTISFYGTRKIEI